MINKERKFVISATGAGTPQDGGANTFTAMGDFGNACGFRFKIITPAQNGSTLSVRQVLNTGDDVIVHMISSGSYCTVIDCPDGGTYYVAAETYGGTPVSFWIRQ